MWEKAVSEMTGGEESDRDGVFEAVQSRPKLSAAVGGYGCRKAPRAGGQTRRRRYVKVFVILAKER